MTAVLSCADISLTYGRGQLAEKALAGISLSFDAGQTCVLLGPSGSGKTTLLSILGCLLSPSEGAVRIGGAEVPFRTPSALVQLRREKIGFVFQHAQLIPFLSIQENLRLVAHNSGMSKRLFVERSEYLTERLGIAASGRRKPAELSGGQQQRAAIARAMIHRPAIVLADEPTAALDWENGHAAMRLLIEQSKVESTLLLTVTHDTRLVDLFDRVIHLDSGRLRSP